MGLLRDCDIFVKPRLKLYCLYQFIGCLRVPRCPRVAPPRGIYGAHLQELVQHFPHLQHGFMKLLAQQWSRKILECTLHMD